MRKYDLFFASLILISCVLILSGTIVFTSGTTEYKPDSALFFLIGGLFGLAGLCGFLIRRKEK